MSDHTTDRWLSVAEIAVHLGVRRTSIYKWITRRGLPGHKVGRLWKFRLAEVDDWVESGQAAGKSADAASDSQHVTVGDE